MHRLITFIIPCSLLLCACSDANSPTNALPHRPVTGVWHRVQAGDTVARLARTYRVARADIEELNGLGPRSRLKKGRKVFIPGGKGAARARAPADAAGSQPASRPSTLATGGDQGSAASKKTAVVRFIWPVSGGKLTSRFGKRGKRPHEGIDIAAAEGTAILAAASGTVIYEGSGLKGYGKLVIIRHRGGLVSVYAHNRRNLVREGVVVKQGQVVAEVGHTGRTTGDHLHFEIRRGEKPLDPQKYVRP